VSVVSRLRELPPELRNAGIAAAALALSLFLPWYEQSYVPEGSREFVQRNVSAFGVFTFVEAAVLLVAAGVLFLVWARSEKKGFHLPGGDGTAIVLAGGWALLLLVWRLFDKPDASTESSSYAIQWGIFAALAAAGALVAMGLRVRAVHRPEPPNPAAEEGEPPQPRPPRRRADPAAVTEVLGERPDWSGEPPEAPGRSRRHEPAPPDEAPTQRSDEAPTRRSDEAPTRRSDEAPTRRSDEAPTRRSDEAPTRRSEDDRLF
jgi:hypothetical protein